ncbi:MAG TPA: lysylphosphatidylglycerol synthase transmembrane domain-containing protein [Candidatus Kapabacteria bacterium]|nr:lysylphosphatidylglycerol synthase transmembrane domain-containing protein [Candidatus Kapabacteria bacterium]
MNRNALKYTIAAALTFGALYLAFRGQDVNTLFSIVKQANIFALFGIVLFQLIAHFIRAWRWQYLLSPVKTEVGLFNSFKAVVAGYAMNNIIPRAGELIRPAMIARSEKIPFAAALATIVLERILDVVALGSILTASLFIFRKQFEAAFPEIASSTLPVLIVIAVVLILFVIVLVNKTVEALLLKLIATVFPQKVAVFLGTAFDTFTTGLRGLSQKTILPIIIGTIGVWLFYSFSTYAGIFVFMGSGIENIGYDGALALLALTGISITIPTPGGTGTYHYFISRALAGFFSIALPSAIAFATITHAVNYIAITLLGLFYMLRAGVSLGKAKEANQEKKGTPKHALRT